MSTYFNIKEHIVPCQHIREFPDATFDDQEVEFVLHVKQYVPRHLEAVSARAVTIIGAHANGFPKELYEVMWESLCRILEKDGIQVRGIWIADAAHQGVSGHLNSDQLGNSPHWDDGARDLLQMVNHFRKEMPRPMVGIGHSLGAYTLASLSLMHPRLLEGGLVLLDPVILSKSTSKLNPANYDINPVMSYVRRSAIRRDQWSSRAEAAQLFEKSRFSQSWDDRVLDLWIDHGLRSIASPESDGADGPVVLSTPKDQEVFTFLLTKFNRLPDPQSSDPIHESGQIHYDPAIDDGVPFYRPEPAAMFEKLPFLRPPTLYLFAETSAMSNPESCKERVERTGTGIGGSGGAKKGKVKQCVIEKAGHLLPFERPEETAKEIGKFLVDSLTSWQEENEAWTTWWKAKDRDERTKISDRWRNELSVTPKPSGDSKGKL